MRHKYTAFLKIMFKYQDFVFVLGHLRIMSLELEERTGSFFCVDPGPRSSWVSWQWSRYESSYL